ncbi:MAG: hypothetical protein UX04_C0001G0161 [Microgenomates group bacterium GW2011_GWF2_45_18]|nr:MAG: hypothetical protein UW18_C0003G0069 [Microgenomates group bacterium GW2011_GWF1_44_10]KKU02390.1 MAG: hypothetical protein UX04_C0001G0161 [Microgenomates group bacterium GW2011_GWF2_45_18]OGJ41718.1 MAG: hypothetical protein A2378_02460 [Candidatus Pacebacteria bacterium RIFOXYB1_FULL_44_10]HAU99143.1 hypothetical protein [Candidatus Paceibacterota bacterium]HAX01673.1 hypothetical protein [Candidatus Paceibacterota bacterium]
MQLTASKLYNYLQCPHRVWRDAYGPQVEKIKETNPFVQLLWDKGVQHEQKAVSRLGDFVDLSIGDQQERIINTKEALEDGAQLLYQPVIQHENLLGIPDFLRRLDDGTYIAVDVKSGRGFEGTEENGDENGPKLKRHYAVQLALYTEILEKIGHSNGKRQGIIYDIEHQEVSYDLNLPLGVRDKRTFWDFYEWLKVEVLHLLANEKRNDPAMAGICKLCPWYDSCKHWVTERDDTTGLFYVGRSARDTLKDDIDLTTVSEAQNLDVDALVAQKVSDKQFLRGLGQKTLEKIKARAEIMANKKMPVLYEALNFPSVQYELFFDIEDDPTQAFVYLHGVYERTPQGTKFIPFVAEAVTPESESKAWASFWSYIRSLPSGDFVLYYYSHHEKTTYKKMAELYPDVATLADVEWLFDKNRAIDLYTDVILKHTDWPVGSYSLKAIAQYLGFKWRDETPSGALSIQWYNEYLKTSDNKILDRILLYNEDDCIATLVIKDKLVKMESVL